MCAYIQFPDTTHFCTSAVKYRKEGMENALFVYKS